MSSTIRIAPQVAEDQLLLLSKLSSQLDKVLEVRSEGPASVAERGALEQVGGLLWQASGLDADTLADALDEARGQEQPLRLEVCGGDYQHLPWEMLFHGDERLGFLSRHPWCVLSRRPQGHKPRVAKVRARPLRVLLFVASPEDLDPAKGRLDYEREEELLFGALDGSLRCGEVALDVAEDGLLSTLVTRLSQAKYHAVLLSLHGCEARNQKDETEWGLLFEDEQSGRSRPVAGSALSSELDQAAAWTPAAAGGAVRVPLREGGAERGADHERGQDLARQGLRACAGHAPVGAGRGGLGLQRRAVAAPCGRAGGGSGGEPGAAGARQGPVAGRADRG